MISSPQTPVKAYTITELAALYDVSIKIFKTWVKPHALEIGLRRGWYFTTMQVRIIFEKIGPP